MPHKSMQQALYSATYATHAIVEHSKKVQACSVTRPSNDELDLFSRLYRWISHLQSHFHLKLPCLLQFMTDINANI